MASIHNIDLVSFTDVESISDEQLSKLLNHCQHVETIKYQPFQPSKLNTFFGFFSPLPRSVIDTYSDMMRSTVQNLAHDQKYDVIISSQRDMAPYVSDVRASIKILEEFELSALYEQTHNTKNAYEKYRRSLMWQKWENFTKRYLRSFDGCTFVSQNELDRTTKILKSKTDSKKPRFSVIPNGVDIEYLTQGVEEPEPYSLVYSGSLTYDANLDAVIYFLEEIYPIILNNYPSAKFYVTGIYNQSNLLDLPQKPGFKLTGYLEDVRPRISNSWISVIPLRIGGGTRLKILESLALGTPVISTTKGAEGLDLIPEHDLLISDEPEGFARSVMRVFNDPELRVKLASNGRRTVEEKYDWRLIGDKLNTFIEDIVENSNDRE
jgi:glycosyltransferase involved in cell wall biosynthesis